MSLRGPDYSPLEDQLLCQIYIDISQDPIVGENQTSKRFWARVEEAYNAVKEPTWEMRTRRSIQGRIVLIEKAVRKLNGGIRQVEHYNPSGASEQDNLDKAKKLIMVDKSFKQGFKFDHVSNIVRNFEKFQDDVTTPNQTYCKHGVNYLYSESENPTHESHPSGSAGLSEFEINLNDIGGSSSDRPYGVKKAKLKKKIEEKVAAAIFEMKEENQRMVEKLDKRVEEKMALKKQSMDLKQERHEDKILLQDTSNISDPNVRAYMEAQKIEILQKRGQLQQPPPSASNLFGDYCPNISGDGANFPEY